MLFGSGFPLRSRPLYRRSVYDVNMGSLVITPLRMVGQESPLVVKKPIFPVPGGTVSVFVSPIVLVSVQSKNGCRSESGGGVLPGLASYQPNTWPNWDVP